MGRWLTLKKLAARSKGPNEMPDNEIKRGPSKIGKLFWPIGTMGKNHRQTLGKTHNKKLDAAKIGREE